jgi:hypothetical protein
MCRLRGSDVAAIGSPAPAGLPPAWTTYVWTPGAHRGAQRVNEPSTHAMARADEREAAHWRADFWIADADADQPDPIRESASGASGRPDTPTSAESRLHSHKPYGPGLSDHAAWYERISSTRRERPGH